MLLMAEPSIQQNLAQQWYVHQLQQYTDACTWLNPDTMMENITVFERAFKAAVADEVARKIATPTPKTGTAKQTGMTRDEFRKLNTAQQAEIYRTNPELYKQMTTR